MQNIDDWMFVILHLSIFTYRYFSNEYFVHIESVPKGYWKVNYPWWNCAIFKDKHTN